MEKDFWLALKDFQTNYSAAQEEKAGSGSTWVQLGNYWPGVGLLSSGGESTLGAPKHNKHIFACVRGGGHASPIYLMCFDELLGFGLIG